MYVSRRRSIIIIKYLSYYQEMKIFKILVETLPNGRSAEIYSNSKGQGIARDFGNGCKIVKWAQGRLGGVTPPPLPRNLEGSDSHLSRKSARKIVIEKRIKTEFTQPLFGENTSLRPQKCRYPRSFTPALGLTIPMYGKERILIQ